jgi:hypothetical protein
MFKLRCNFAGGVASALAACLALAAAAQAAPELGKTFSAVNLVSRQARVQVTLSNPDAQSSQLTATLTDTLPAGLRVADPPRASTTCIGGSLTLQAAAVTLASGATIPSAGACTFGFDVVADAPGDYENAIAAGALQTTTGSNAQAATATLSLPALASEVGLSQRFAPASITPGGISRLTVTLTNTAEMETTTTADLVDLLPAGLVVASPPNASTDCINGVLSTTSGSFTLAAGAEVSGPFDNLCSFSVDVTSAAAGSYANVIPAGALQTPVGSNTAAAVAVLTVVNAGPRNGNFAHGPYYAQFSVGRMLNMVAGVTAVVSDPLNDSSDFDIGFSFVFGSGYNAVVLRANESAIAVDENGKALVLRIGDSVGPEQLFAVPNPVNRDVPLGDEFQQGTNAFIGVRFNCDGRLRYPVPGRHCYGYVHLITDPIGFATDRPQGVIESAFNGDGEAIVIARGVGIDAPALSVVPNKLALTAPADGVAYAKLALGNANGSDPLTYTAAPRQTREPDEPQLLPVQAAFPPGAVVSIGTRPAPAWVAPGGVLDFLRDDGSLESATSPGSVIPQVGWSRSFGAVFLNQFAATGPLTIDSVSIFWPAAEVNGAASGMTAGRLVKLAVYYDPSASGNPANALRVTADEIAAIEVLDAFQTYPLHARIPGPGDVYIGFVNHWANVSGGTVPFVSVGALDTTAPQGKSWLSFVDSEVFGEVADDRRLANNDRNIRVEDFGQSGNFMIRATATAGGVGGLCSGPPVDWISATPASASVDGGSSVDIDVRADPTGLAPGVYNAELCFTSNDPDDPVFWVPVTFTVLPAGSPRCATLDTIFCFGHERQLAPTVSGGYIGENVDEQNGGHWFDFAKAQFQVASDFNQRPGKDIRLQPFFGFALISVSWMLDTLPEDIAAQVGGVVGADGVDYATLQPGDTIGPGSLFSSSDESTMTAFEKGGRFYLGIRFYNETRQALNYGYLELETSPGGFPVRVLGYAYDFDGRAITIPAE